MNQSVGGWLQPHQVEAQIKGVIGGQLSGRGWDPRVVPYTGYGANGWVRVLARTLLVPPGWLRETTGDARGWRRFLAVPSVGMEVNISIGGRTHIVTSGEDGYLDVRLEVDLEPGWHEAHLAVEGSDPVPASIRVVGPGTRLGIISDIDDTVIVTMLPRPLVAFRNAFLVRENNRKPVPGMTELFWQLLADEPDAFVLYLSTGAWNTADALNNFLARHGYPEGPLLLTEWGPTPEGWFRSGPSHKRSQLARLFEELPQLRWILIGDDGQHDPSLYDEAAQAQPDKVLEVVIRQLTLTEQVVSHGIPTPKDGTILTGKELPGDPVRAPDGFGLIDGLKSRGKLGNR